MKYHLVYFSSTGNSAFLAEKAKEHFETAGHEVKSFEALAANLDEVFQCDIIGLHFPIWGSEAAKPMRWFLKKMGTSGKSAKVYMISDCAKMPGNGTHFEARSLAKASNGKIKTFYTQNIKMPCNFNIGIFNLHQSSELISQIVEKATKEIKLYTKEILNGKESIEKGNPMLKPLFPLIRNIEPIFLRKLAKKLNSDPEKCIRCRMCVKICPVENITLNPETNCIDFSDKCVFCLKCYNFCPTAAINVGGETPNTEKYARYKGHEKRPRINLYRK